MVKVRVSAHLPFRKNYGEIKEYLDKEVKRISFKTHDEYDESMDGEMYLLYTDRILEIEVE